MCSVPRSPVSSCAPRGRYIIAPHAVPAIAGVSQVCCLVRRRGPATQELCTHLAAAQQWLRHPVYTTPTDQPNTHHEQPATRVRRLRQYGEKCGLSFEGKCIS
jgi:hypothetical protein